MLSLRVAIKNPLINQSLYYKHTCPMSHQKTNVAQQKRTQNAIM